MHVAVFFLIVFVKSIDGQGPIKNFVPFGIANGDATIARQLDSVTPPIRINTLFPFFNKVYDEIKIYSHGLILFGNVTYTLPHNPPGPFPLLNFVCASPYWADTDLTQDASSNIFYRQISDGSTLSQITDMVRKGFPELSAHRMLWAFAATWYRVPGHKADPGRNTFQAILTTNGLYSFIMFTYDQLQWSAGLWGGYPQVGFNAGDENNFFTLEKSFTSDVITIVQDSNIGVTGQFIFHSTGDIGDVRCNTSHGLQSSPFRGSMYGGYELSLLGICFDELPYTIEIDGKQVNNCSITLLYITCKMPMVTEGRLKIRVLASGGRLVGETEFLSFMPETNADVILSNFGTIDNAVLLKEDRRLQLNFLQNTLTTNYLFRLFIYDYSTQYDVENDIFYNLTAKTVDLGLGALNLSTLKNLTINFPSIFSSANEPRDLVHSLGISFEMILPNTTSNVSSWKGPKQFIVRPFIVSFSIVSSYCSNWFAQETDVNTRNLTNLVPACPCRVRTSWDEEQFGFNADPTCNARKSGSWNCRFNRGARGCYRRKSTTSDAGAHCCYDNNGVRITDFRRGSGSLKAHYPEAAKTLSIYRNFFYDFLPYVSCCGISLEVLSTCQQYTRHRPPGRCDNMLPAPSGGGGDPHFSTLDGKSYTFNGHGEYTLLKSVDNDFEIQVRLARVTGSTSSIDSATAIVAFVIHHKDQSRVQFELLTKLKIVEIHIDERLLEYTPLSQQDELLSSSLIYSDDKQLIIRQSDEKTFSISYGDSGIQFIVNVRPQHDYMDLLSIVPATLKEQKIFQGILGGFDGLTYANGTHESAKLDDDQALFAFGESWRTASASSLFYYRVQDSHAQHQDLNYRPIFQKDLFNKYANTSRYQMAENVCRQFTHQLQCIYDILVTNDSTIVEMHQAYESIMEDLNNYTTQVEQDKENQAETTIESITEAPTLGVTTTTSMAPTVTTTSMAPTATTTSMTQSATPTTTSMTQSATPTTTSMTQSATPATTSMTQSATPTTSSMTQTTTNKSSTHVINEVFLLLFVAIAILH